MKLVCQETCVVKQGRIIEKGESYDTGDVSRKEDREAHDLIAAGRMVEARDVAAVEAIEQQVASEKKAKAAKAAKDKSDK